MTAKKSSKKPAPKTAGRTRASSLMSPEERAAMKDTIQERKRALAGEADGEADVQQKISEMAEPDRTMAKRIHTLVKATAPDLSPKTFYGMPAYARNGKIVVFFQSGQKYKTRYSTLGFQQEAKLDDGDFWSTSYAVKKLTPAVEEKIKTLVKTAAR